MERLGQEVDGVLGGVEGGGRIYLESLADSIREGGQGDGVEAVFLEGLHGVQVVRGHAEDLAGDAEEMAFYFFLGQRRPRGGGVVHGGWLLQKG